VEAAGDVGALPAVTAGAGLSGAVLLRRVRVELEGTAWLPERVTASARPSAGGHLAFLSASVSCGPRFFVGDVELGPRVGLELGWMHATGFGVVQPGEASALWRATLGGLVVGVPVTRSVHGRFELAALLPLDRPRWLLDQVGEVGRSSVVVARVGVGAEMRF
jgi:hypothetical protein